MDTTFQAVERPEETEPDTEDVMRTVELIAHCWRFSRALNYLLSSLVLHPPKFVNVLATVCYSPADDGTASVLDFFALRSLPPTVCVRPWRMEEAELLNRTIGRNYLAKRTPADVAWFIDCDYFLGDGCLDGLAHVQIDPTQASYSPLYFPANTPYNVTKETGDSYSDRAATPGIYDIDPVDFVGYRPRKAIGGIQIVPGDVARETGYCDSCRRYLRPVTDGRWQATKADMLIRRILGTSGRSIDLPNCYRIRQSMQGQVDCRPPTELALHRA